VRTKSEELFGVKAQLIALERQRATQLREIAALQAERRELPLRSRAAQGEIERDLALVAQQSAKTPPGNGSSCVRRRTALCPPWSPRSGKAWPPPPPWRA
jgi:hypothetical protein